MQERGPGQIQGILEQGRGPNPRPVLSWAGMAAPWLFSPPLTPSAFYLPSDSCHLLAPFSIPQLSSPWLPPPRVWGAQVAGDEEGGKRKPSLSFSLCPYSHSLPGRGAETATLESDRPGTSLVVQWRTGVCLPIQETQVWSLVREDPACPGATQPQLLSLCARAGEPQLLNPHTATTEAPEL